MRGRADAQASRGRVGAGAAGDGGRNAAYSQNGTRMASCHHRNGRIAIHKSCHFNHDRDSFTVKAQVGGHQKKAQGDVVTPRSKPTQNQHSFVYPFSHT
jgi:hypothetical protein